MGDYFSKFFDASDLTEIRQRIVLNEFAPKSCVIDEFGQVLNAAPDMKKYLSLGGRGLSQRHRQDGC